LVALPSGGPQNDPHPQRQGLGAGGLAQQGFQ